MESTKFLESEVKRAFHGLRRSVGVFCLHYGGR